MFSISIIHITNNSIHYYDEDSSCQVLTTIPTQLGMYS
jgi:hypothetical protein